jgi:DNA-binding IscR family transcriptional regulator
VAYTGSASQLAEVWIAVRVALRSVLEQVTLADLVAGVLPARVKELTTDADAWVSRGAGGHTPPPTPRRARA